MFRLKDTDPEEEESNQKSKYFVAGKILKNKTTTNPDPTADDDDGHCRTAAAASTATVANSANKVITGSIGSSTTTISQELSQLTTTSSAMSKQQSTDDQLSATASGQQASGNSSGDGDSGRRKRVVFGNTLLVNPNQKANKLLKQLRSAYQLSADISPAHYLMYDSCCAVFLSLKYHVIYNNYIYDTVDKVRNTYQLTVLLVLVDHIEYREPLKELTQLAIRTNCTLMLAWSYEEAATIIENYRHFADKTPDIIMGKQSSAGGSTGGDYQSLVEALTSVKSINNTDAVTLLTTFDTMENIVNADDDQLIICPGMAALKAQRLRKFFNKPFIRKE
ncbi:DNA excision repair protein ERCC-1-like [Oppia nitens]|uniref:DNA excision repair protein ERCC-1-like n=1 Tax=Oppia nitens TaxID=1686743 RepID=UPI0023DB61DF|nr:DNA excision repair protein ERCC-1-like [Oppia nitens]